MNTATIIVDNNKAQHRFLKTEHGFSLYLEYNDTKVLFDFGATDKIINNIRTLNINFQDIKYLVSSHSHYDHINGLYHAAPLLCNKELFVGSNFDLKKYGKVYKSKSIMDYLGSNFDVNYLKQFNIQKHYIKDKYKLSDDIYIISNFKHTQEDENFHRFVIEKDGKLINDYFEDELCLVIERTSDLILIVGCSHPGIINIIKKVNSLFSKNISTIIGGTHLSKKGDREIDELVKQFMKLKIKEYYLCHCSGQKIQNALISKGLKCVNIGVGSTLLL